MPSTPHSSPMKCLMRLFEALCVAYCGKSGERMAPQWLVSTVGSWAGCLMPNLRLQFELESWKKS